MTGWITKHVYRRGLAHLERGDIDAVLASFSRDCTLTFVGDTPLGAKLSGLPDLRLWFERFGRLLPRPRFEVQTLVVGGPLWNQRLASHVLIHSSINGESYTNQFAHFLRLRWGKVVDDLVLEDTQRWERACRRLLEAGIAEAGAEPMAGNPKRAAEVRQAA